MRTQGNFQKVFNAVRRYFEDRSDCPINPVIRRDGGTWILESKLNPTDGDIEVGLDDFSTWWYDGLTDHEFQPSDDDIDEYLKLNGL